MRRGRKKGAAKVEEGTGNAMQEKGPVRRRVGSKD